MNHVSGESTKNGLDVADKGDKAKSEISETISILSDIADEKEEKVGRKEKSRVALHMFARKSHQTESSGESGDESAPVYKVPEKRRKDWKK